MEVARRQRFPVRVGSAGRAEPWFLDCGERSSLGGPPSGDPSSHFPNIRLTKTPEE